MLLPTLSRTGLRVPTRELIAGATYEDIKVAIPKGAKRTIPAKLADPKAKRGNDK